METLIAFSCYYRADNSRMAGKMEQFYTVALARYKTFKYPDFHVYIARKMTAWYKQFPWDTKADEEEDEAEGAEPEVGAAVEAPPVLADGATGAFAMSPEPDDDDGGGGEEEAGIRDKDVLLGGEKEADNVAAVTEGEARLAAAAGAAAAAPAAAARP